jgi:tetratricopeptide (TPR) repeat protein
MSVGGVAEGSGHVFVSYVREDSPAAGRLHTCLEDAGIRVWRDVTDLRPGEDWQAEIRQAISDSALVFLACFSRAGAARQRSYQRRELIWAIEHLQLRSHEEPWLIPVRFDDCLIPDWNIGAGRTLRSLQHLDLFGDRPDEQMRLLVGAVARVLGARTAPVQDVLRLGSGDPVAAPPLPVESAVQRSSAVPTTARRDRDAIVVRSAYMQQVRRIAPPDPPGLIGRDTELDALAAFCQEPDGGSYLWWRAGAWAGKSALMSTFVLRPPSDVTAAGTRIVSFFITARLAAQDTRDAFTQVLLGQLAELARLDLPTALPESMRDIYLLDLMDQAANACRDAGGRLILVVDGLDEDRSVTTGPDAHSIAGLLPADPPAGMRVIVASRPAPPVPDDVPDWHPLREPSIVRSLKPSAYARDMQRLASQELRRLLHGTQAEQDVLGLLTAARGDLTAPDLADLTRSPLWEIEDILHAAAGRTFTRRAGPAGGPEGYLLGHEELHAAARRYLAPRLGEYYERLYRWAGHYQDCNWPPDTPAYLLAGYYQLLYDLGDAARMIACASDSARHDRMLDITGGDGAAHAEIRTVLDLLAAQDNPDLGAALALACHRDQLTSRNADIPASLPEAWAVLGKGDRAQALASSIPDPERQADALRLVAGELAEARQFDQAGQVTRSIRDPYWQGQAQVQLAGALARAGKPAQAEEVARSVSNPYRQADAWRQLAGARAEAGEFGQAEQIARSISNADRRSDALMQLAGTLAGVGQFRRAEQIARSISEPRRQGHAEVQIAGALAAAGHYTHAEQIASSISYPDQRADALTLIACAFGRAGQHTDAEHVIGSIRDPDGQGRGQVLVAGTLADAGRFDQAEQLARSIRNSTRQAKGVARVAIRLADDRQFERAERIARSISNATQQADALAQIAGKLADTMQFEQAERVARSISHPSGHTDALVRVAVSLTRAGRLLQATTVAEQAEKVARSISSPTDQTQARTRIAGVLAQAGQFERAEQAISSIGNMNSQIDAKTQVAVALAGAGQFDQAEQVADSISYPDRRADALAQVAVALARAGQRQRAAALASLAEKAARPINDPLVQANVLVQIAGTLVRSGQHQPVAAVAAGAEQVARSISNPYQQGRALAQVAEALAEAGQFGQAERIARSISNSQWQRHGMVQFAEALARAGQFEQAERIARSISDPYQQGESLAQVADALADVGQFEQAERIARSITNLRKQGEGLAHVADALAEAGQFEQAEQIACSISDPRWHRQGMLHLTEALARAGQFGQAEQIARSITDPKEHSIRDPGLVPVRDPYQQGQALMQVASGLAEAANSARPRR